MALSGKKVYAMKIWEFFENMNECVYASDIDTDELVYMNKKALRMYGIHSLDEIAGKKCYEVLQHCSAPVSYTHLTLPTT